VDVVSQCSFPIVDPDQVPYRRLGYDCEEIMKRCVAIIEMQKRGEVPPPVTRILARFDDEARVK
jgi:hypothetical protein